nr:nuclease-related domain-containing protein [Thermoanaerobacter italicus]
MSEKEQGNSGENSVGWALHLWFPSNAVIVNDLVLEVEPDRFMQIDHLVLNTNGIFVLETKAWDGAFLGTKDCSMPVVIGGMNAVGEIRKIKGENISEEDVNLIIEAVKNAKPLDHEEWKRKHSKRKEEDEKRYQVTTGKTSNGKMYVRILGTKEVNAMFLVKLHEYSCLLLCYSEVMYHENRPTP